MFPASAACPECGKKIRIKWSQTIEAMTGLRGLGRMKCLHCGTTHVRTVGTAEAVEQIAQAFEMKFHQACGHDHEHDHSHGVRVIPGDETFAYIRLPA